MNNDEDFFDKIRNRQSADSYSEQLEIESKADIQGQKHPIEDEINNDINAQAGMPPESRRALVTLLKYGVILAAKKQNLFELICRYQTEIRRHLSDMYLNLILDEKSGVAFVSNENAYHSFNKGFPTNNPNDEESISLISNRTLSLFDTLLLLVLRKHYQERETSGEQKIIIDIERIESNLCPFLPLSNSSKSDRKKINASLQRMIKKRLLTSISGSDNRFEITPIIRYVVNADFLENMLSEYKKLASEAVTSIEKEAQ